MTSKVINLNIAHYLFDWTLKNSMDKLTFTHEEELDSSIPNKKLIVNHVMSRDIDSSIFNAILGYFNQFGSTEFKHIASVAPITNAHIYHYHRPHLEEKLLPNSVCTVHHDLDDPDPWHAKFRFIPRYMEASAVVCLNNTQKEILVTKGLPSNKLYIVPHGYHAEYLKPKSGITGASQKSADSRKLTLGIASRRYGRRVKGEAYLLELAKRLDPEHFNFIFVGQDRTLSTVAMRNLGYEAIAYERLPYRMFQSFYNAIDILLMCSSYEGGPANTPEALATGTPMFSSCVGMPKDVIINEKNGLFLTLDPDYDAKKIMDICVYNPEKLEDIIKGAQQIMDRALTWEQSIKGNLKAYKDILNSSN